LHEAARTGGELIHLPKLSRRRQPLPLLVLIDVSGSMERYARLLLAFLHASTRRAGRLDDFAGGTRLGDSLAQLRHGHARRLTGRRTLVLVISDGLDTGEPEALERE